MNFLNQLQFKFDKNKTNFYLTNENMWASSKASVKVTKSG